VLLLLASRGWYTRGYRAAVGRLVLPRCCLCVYEIGGSIRSIGRSIGGSQMTANQTTSGQFVFFTRPPRGNFCGSFTSPKPDHLGAICPANQTTSGQCRATLPQTAAGGRQTIARRPGGSWGWLAASVVGPMLALFASAMMMVPRDSDSSEGACDAPNTTTAAPSSDVSLRLPATGVRPPAAPSPASSVGETPTATLRTQAWRKGNVKAMWSVIEKGMFEDEERWSAPCLGALTVRRTG
jgi:hypothetical protein